MLRHSFPISPDFPPLGYPVSHPLFSRLPYNSRFHYSRDPSPLSLCHIKIHPRRWRRASTGDRAREGEWRARIARRFLSPFPHQRAWTQATLGVVLSEIMLVFHTITYWLGFSCIILTNKRNLQFGLRLNNCFLPYRVREVHYTENRFHENINEHAVILC